MKKYLSSLVIVGMAIILVYQNKELKQCRLEGLQGGDIVKGELQDSLTAVATELGKYEMAFELFKKEDSLAANKFEDILYTQTDQ